MHPCRTVQQQHVRNITMIDRLKRYTKDGSTDRLAKRSLKATRKA